MNVLERAAEFLRDQPPSSDSLPELLRVRAELSSVLRALLEDPTRLRDAVDLLGALAQEQDRLAQQVGLEVAARATRAEASVPAEADDRPRASSPPPDEAAPQPTNGTPALEAEVRAWTASHRVGERSSSPGPSAPLLLHGLLDKVGRPPEPDRALEAGEELDRLDDGLGEEALGDLRQLPSDVQRKYLRMATARLNVVRVASDVLARERARGLLDCIREYTKEYRPGAVHGLARDHEPKRGSWAADGAALWRELGGSDTEVAPPSGRLPAPRRRAPILPDQPDDGDARAPEPDWRCWGSVRGCSVLMVGGSPREPARERVEGTFEMQELVWIADDPRKAQSAEARIDAGGFDLVLLLLRFASHPTSEKLRLACESRGVPFVPVEHGYGAAAIKQSLERFLGRAAAVAAG